MQDQNSFLELCYRQKSLWLSSAVVSLFFFQWRSNKKSVFLKKWACGRLQVVSTWQQFQGMPWIVFQYLSTAHSGSVESLCSQEHKYIEEYKPGLYKPLRFYKMGNYKPGSARIKITHLLFFFTLKVSLRSHLYLKAVIQVTQLSTFSLR